MTAGETRHEAAVPEDERALLDEKAEAQPRPYDDETPQENGA